ncbi:hypothetical protein P153DRAFT_305617 [Dothidotthia symphoricarpi CBS 119687]|uniref:C2H2-type domain-containing protein n=1 Tax=Dothidotthia symphoricarpi CBS 119687 TaxID=1392245 RepID=A0A6A6AV53_9PLEO|nr:uncharacterized protein P153DRAFT_305617 [Dothidotthia symphoricarpi CBS 119687]KAF2134824.1 hypothetical protein P153DRAFT_305617 [Dothidotthia symphoricarpi CBS 119687]
MLSTNSPSGIQRRRAMHRRQNSTPSAYEAPTIRPLPATNPQQRRHNRTGMSLDLRGLNLDSIRAHSSGPSTGPRYPGPFDTPSFRQDANTVSNTNLGQYPQHSMQVAQTYSQPQPGHQDSFLRSPVQTSLPIPQTPRRIQRAQSPQQPPVPSSLPPTEQQLKDLHEHIQSVYGSCGQVFINILPTPSATPQKPAQLPSHEALNVASLPANFTDLTDINLEPTSSAMTFDFEHPDVDLGYESSSYYTSDAVSPSSPCSPDQKTMQTFLEGIAEHPSQEMFFSQAPPMLPQSDNSMLLNGLPLSDGSMDQNTTFDDLEVDASLEFTGIAPEEVQRYISEQNAVTNKWTCLFQDCGKVFGRRENIRSHVQTHLGDRQYKCNGCGKCFVRQHDLKRHAKIHSGNKPYKCPCGAGFARQDALTRHRQRGMCVGGFADAVRRQAKRGRPKKNRPDMEQRTDKSSRTRQALASNTSSVSASSPYSDARSPSPFDAYEPTQPHSLPELLSRTSSYNDQITSSSDAFGLSSPFDEGAHRTTSSFASSSSYVGDITSMNLLQQLSQDKHTPPMSPVDLESHLSGPANVLGTPFQPTSLKASSSPSQLSVQSQQFTTPPTSPVDVKDDLDELFNTPPENSCSQFELEMKAMGEFTSMDSASYDFLDFTV